MLLDISHTYGMDVGWLFTQNSEEEELLKMDMLGINRTYTTGYSQNKDHSGFMEARAISMSMRICD